MSQLIDLSRPLSHNMPVYPGEKPPALILDRKISDDGYTSYRLESAMHAGTHIDAPMHVFDVEKTIDRYEVELFAGKACLIDVRGLNPVKYRDEWKPLYRENDFVLFFTGHDQYWDTPEYYDQYPDFDREIAKRLCTEGVRIVGFDSPSPDRMPYDFHLTFLNGERFMLENLTNFSSLPVNRSFRLFAFPLKIQAEASLVRVVAEVQ